MRHMKRTLILVGLAVVLFEAAVVLVYFGPGWFFAAKPLLADDLEKTALADGDPAGQQKAAAALIGLGRPALPNIRRVFQQSQSPEVRAIMIQGIAQTRDMESKEDILKALEDDSYVVRVQAWAAVQRLLFFGGTMFKPGAPREARVEAIKALHQLMADMKKEADRQIREGLGKREPGQPQVPIGSANK